MSVMAPRITGDPTICSTLYWVLHKTEHQIPRYRPSVRGVPLRMSVSCFLVCSSQWRFVSAKTSQISGNSTFVQQIVPANKNEIPSVVFITYPLWRISVYDIRFRCNKGQKCGNGFHAMSASWLMLHRWNVRIHIFVVRFVHISTQSYIKQSIKSCVTGLLWGGFPSESQYRVFLSAHHNDVLLALRRLKSQEMQRLFNRLFRLIRMK